MTIRAGLSAALPLVVCASDVHYKYNARSELTRVTRAGEVLYGYEYDLAGNLIWSCNGSRTNVYERNCLNQYTTVSDSEGNVYRFTYDEDGNLVQDNRRVYIWDSGSRLEVSRPLPGEGGVAIRDSYDAFGRRVKKDTWYVAPFGTYPPERPISTTTYMFDGSLLVRETIEEIGGTVKQTEYIWGKDISGSLDGAGGVGGLLAVKIDGATYVPIYDVGGNITAYCSSSGSVVAERNYSPFGQMISARSDNDPLFRRLHFWFSTKYLDLETGLYYFGGRFYSPFLCRWLNRDPIGEQGASTFTPFAATTRSITMIQMAVHILSSVSSITCPGLRISPQMRIWMEKILSSCTNIWFMRTVASARALGISGEAKRGRTIIGKMLNGCGFRDGIMIVSCGRLRSGCGRGRTTFSPIIVKIMPKICGENIMN